MKKRLLSILLCLVFVLTLAPICLPASAATTVKSIAITIAEPEVGKTPPNSVTCRGSGYTLHGIDWLDETEDRYLEAGEKIQAGHKYVAQIWVKASSGYEFAHSDDRTPTATASVNGNAAQVSKAYEYNAFAMVVVSCSFNPGEIKTLAIELEGLQSNGYILTGTEGEYVPFAIKSASAPVAVYPELNTNRYYPKGFHWSNMSKSTTIYDGERFKGGYEYYVTVAIKPTDSRTFADNMAITINGFAGTLKAHGSTYAEVGISVTCFGGIYSYNIMPVVTLPKAGNHVDYSVTYAYPQCEHIDYASVLGWYDVATGTRLTSDDKFEAGKQYRVEVQLMAAYPYVFAREADGKLKNNPYVTGHEADSYTFGYDDYRGRETITVVKTFSTEAAVCTHTPSAWRTTGIYHYKVCTACGEFLEQEDHYGGTATCTEKAKCEVCGTGYGQNEPDHKWSPTYLYQDSAGHAWICADCKAHSEIEPHIPGPTGTPDTAVVCKDCGYVITPEKNHKHELSKVPQTPATCLEDGNIEYYICSGCNDRFTDPEGTNKIPETMGVGVGALGHTVSEVWGIDETYHWRVCTACNQVLEETKMQHDMQEDKCVTCGYAEGMQIPEETHGVSSGEPGEPDDGVSWLIIALIALACFGAAVTATVIVWKKKKTEE